MAHDTAQIKVHTFPFTKYGAIPATVTRQRRIIDYLLSPISKHVQESRRER